MHVAFLESEYILKRYGRISGGKYRLYSVPDDAPLLFIEEDTESISPLNTTHVYVDEGNTHKVLTLTDSEDSGIAMEVIDAEVRRTIGGIAMAVDAAGDFIKDAWVITDAGGNIIGKVLGKTSGRFGARAASGAEPPQRMDVTFGGALVGELRQKVNVVGYELLIDFRADVAQLLDRRLGIAAAIFTALQQGKVE
jgi:hypothetical protein